MQRAGPSHFSGVIEAVHENEDDGTITLDIRAPHELRRITDTRARMVTFLRAWAEADCPRVQVHGDGSLSLTRRGDASHPAISRPGAS